MSQVTCRILCIDDHDDTSEMLSLILSQEDFEVVTTRSVEEALNHARVGAFDLYVLDKHLPDGSGLDLCAKLNEVTPGVPCLVYSGDAYAIHRSEALAAGAHAYVVKPDIEGLIETVHKLLSEKHCAAAS
ncbi:MAG TPA: response regulator [Pyrinomonadaceae bacterium]|nr:response regulator [Pyrinomonadaceae bacterium]